MNNLFRKKSQVLDIKVKQFLTNISKQADVISFHPPLPPNATAAESSKHTTPELSHWSQVHEIELEMQNENLRQAYSLLEESNDHYVDLYEFAPVAYLTLTKKGLIKETNLAGETLFAVKRQNFLQRQFADFVSSSDKDYWQLFFKQQLKQNQQHTTIDLSLKPANGKPFYAQLNCLRVLDDGQPTLRITLTDITRFKQTAIVRDDDEAYRSILATTLDGFWVVNHQGKFVDVNTRYSEQSGYSREELLNMSIPDVEIIESPANVAERIERVIKKGGDLFESMHRRKDGTLWHVEISVTYRHLNNGFFHVFLRDITQRKLAEHALKAAQNRVSNILNSLTMQIKVLDTEGRVIAVNQAWEQLEKQKNPSHDSENIIGCNYLDICAKKLETDSDEKTVAIFQGITAVLIGAQESFRTEYSCLLGDEQHWFQMTALPMRNESGVVICKENITERKLAEKVIKQSEEMLRAITDNTNLVIFIKDLHGRFIFTNRMFERLFQVNNTEICGKTDYAIFPKDLADKFNRDDQVVFESGRPFTLEETVSNAVGIADTYITVKFPLKNFSGDIYGLCGISTNITERKNYEQEIKQLSDSELNKAKLAAEKANKAKSEFLSSMSHELRTPMNAVLGFAQLLEMEELTEDQLESVRYILTAGRHLLDLINGALDLSRIEADKLDLTAEKLELNALIQECMTLTQSLAAKNGIKLINQIGIKCNSTVIADSLRLKQTLLNLISNAIKYNRTGGSVTLSCEIINSKTERIRITDTGVGLSEEQIARLFQPFERLNAQNSAIEGTGIGLCISKKLIEAMNGRMGVESTVGVGSCFWIEVPLA